MTAVFGFGGVQAGQKRVIMNPRLYKKWEALQFSLIFKGDRFNVKITKDNVAITAAASNKRSQAFVVWGKSISCAPGKSAATKYRQK
jgi:trehalose/maltose hydrolase-like predicted phosphorylase